MSLSEGAGVETELYVQARDLPTPLPKLTQATLVHLRGEQYVALTGLRDMGGHGVLYKVGLRNVQSPPSGGGGSSPVTYGEGGTRYDVARCS